MPEDARFYFVHSYHPVCDDPCDQFITANYGYPFAAGLHRANIYGVQFHPEKSHRFGMKLLKNFIERV
jgi:glutamine amidotransferase